MAPSFRLFISSPGDAAAERRRAENVVSRLNGEFAGAARLTAIRWETQFYRADATFQTQIPPAADCDIVVGILRWRLGVELPPGFEARLPTGEPYPSGTAYELLSAIDKRKAGGALPDVFVFRYSGGSPRPELDDPNRAAIERDWTSLRAFFERWFVTRDGHFLAALNSYASEDQFESELEKLLRDWLTQKVAGGRRVAWPIETKGSPFRGLDSFGARHAPVFFGRRRDVARALDLWREAGARLCPFLLLVGASGSGKSSLARAGLCPRLTTPGVIQEVDVWRVAVMRPGDDRAGPMSALAEALLQGSEDLPKDEEGRGAALPEIAEGDWRTPADLTEALLGGGVLAQKPLLNALARIEAREQARDNYGRAVRCDLALIVDQFEELFAESISAQQRDNFVDLLAALAQTGRVWIVATLRADFYPRILASPALKELKETGATYDLAPPGPVELAEIVRGPADAAGLIFEVDELGESLDARILRDADRADMLPLVQLTLSRLFDGRTIVNGQVVLSGKVYNELGGLKGIVDEAGERALASLGEVEKAQLPRVLRQLAAPADEEDGSSGLGLTIRTAALSEFTQEPGARRLVEALTAARILSVSGAKSGGDVRLAHQRVLEDWRRARSIVAESADFYRIRRNIEEQRKRWETGGRSRDFLIGPGRPLAEGESVARNFVSELAPETLDFIDRSSRRARLRHRLTSAAAMVFAAIALVASALGVVAYRTEREASRNFEAAVEATNTLGTEVAEGLRPLAGVSARIVGAILKIAEAQFDRLAAVAPDSASLQWRRATLLVSLADTYLSLNAPSEALRNASAAVDAMDKLTAKDSTTNDQWQLTLADAHRVAGDALRDLGRFADARAQYQASLDIRQRLVARNPQNPALASVLGIGYGRLGYLAAAQNQPAAALTQFRAGLQLREALAAKGVLPASEERNRFISHRDVADMLLRLQDRDGALKEYQSALALATSLEQKNPLNGQIRWDVAVLQSRVGDVETAKGDAAEGLAALRLAAENMRELQERDPDDPPKTRDLAIIQRDFAAALTASGDKAQAYAALLESLSAYRELVSLQPKVVPWRHAEAGVLMQMAAVAAPEQVTSAKASARALLQQMQKDGLLIPVEKEWLARVSAEPGIPQR